jgi:hypothetical protein
MADDPVPRADLDDKTNAAIIASGRDPSSLGAVFESTLNKSGEISAAADAEFEAVFGVGAKRDAKGQPIEIGKGSKAQQTEQHRVALQKEAGRAALTGR